MAEIESERKRRISVAELREANESKRRRGAEKAEMERQHPIGEVCCADLVISSVMADNHDKAQPIQITADHRRPETRTTAPIK